MTEIMNVVGQLLAYLFVSYDGTATDGAVQLVTKAAIADPLLVIPIALLLVGLGIGVIARIMNTVRG